MTYRLDETHDPKAVSWIESANVPDNDFPVQNLAYGVFHSLGDAQKNIGIAIGEFVLDLKATATTGWLKELDGPTLAACHSDSLNDLMKLDAASRLRLRRKLFSLLHSHAAYAARESLANLLIPRSDLEMQVPVRIGDYTDFYASIFHATNVGRLFRPDNPLLPNYKWIPIGYHGRSSSIVVSGTQIHRPKGQIKSEKDAGPVYGYSNSLDYELELGVYVSHGNPLGKPIAISDAEEHLFGVSLVNDWSARDIQSWEYQPLGPFLAKNFATTISPWVITMEALAPFRCPSFSRSSEDPQPLPYLDGKSNREQGGIAVTVEACLETTRMREQKIAPLRLCRGSFRDMYWTLGQLLAHHSSTGCNMRAGDLLASGTISGESEDSRGCLLELTRNGKQKLQLPTGDERTFLEDGDEIILLGWCERQGATRIGLGECRGRIQCR